MISISKKQFDKEFNIGSENDLSAFVKNAIRWQVSEVMDI